MSVSVGYNRRRSARSGKVEGTVTSLVLLAAGVVVVFAILHRLSLVQLPF